MSERGRTWNHNLNAYGCYKYQNCGHLSLSTCRTCAYHPIPAEEELPHWMTQCSDPRNSFRGGDYKSPRNTFPSRDNNRRLIIIRAQPARPVTWQRWAQVCLRIRRTWGIESPSGIYFLLAREIETLVTNTFAHQETLSIPGRNDFSDHDDDAFLCRRRAIHNQLLFINMMWVEIFLHNNNNWQSLESAIDFGNFKFMNERGENVYLTFLLLTFCNWIPLEYHWPNKVPTEGCVAGVSELLVSCSSEWDQIQYLPWSNSSNYKTRSHVYRLRVLSPPPPSSSVVIWKSLLVCLFSDINNTRVQQSFPIFFSGIKS